MQALFGDVMSMQEGDVPSHDVEMRPALQAYGRDLAKRAAVEQDTQTQTHDDPWPDRHRPNGGTVAPARKTDVLPAHFKQQSGSQPDNPQPDNPQPNDRAHHSPLEQDQSAQQQIRAHNPQHSPTRNMTEPAERCDPQQSRLRTHKDTAAFTPRDESYSMDADLEFARYMEGMDAASGIRQPPRPQGDDAASWEKGFDGASAKLRGDHNVELGLLCVKRG